MTDHHRVGTRTKTIAWLVAAMLPVVALTTSAVPWQWSFAFLYVAIAFGLQALVPLKNPGGASFVHLLVLSGSTPIVVRSYFGNDLTSIGVVNVVAVLVVAIGVGYLLAGLIGPRAQTPGSAV